MTLDEYSPRHEDDMQNEGRLGSYHWHQLNQQLLENWPPQYLNPAREKADILLL
jgi:hypothetical protein